jgi:Protein of unknown function (DUF2384)
VVPEVPRSETPAGQKRSFDNDNDRLRMSGPGLRTFFGIAKEWGLSVDQQCTLLGDIARSTFHKWKKDGAPGLTRDQLERISLVLGIYKAMKLLFADSQAGRGWFQAPNREWVFGGRPPLERMLCGSIDDLYAVRRYLDSWRGVR